MILETRRGGTIDVRTGLADLLATRGGGPVASGVSVTNQSARGVPAIGQAVRIAAEAVAQLAFGVWRGEGTDRERVSTVWQSRLFSSHPNPIQTRFAYWETVEESLSYRGNAFVWKSVDPVSKRVVEEWALHPDQVMPGVSKGRPVFQVYLGPGYLDPVAKGNGIITVGPETILHIRGFGGGGLLVAPSPVQLYRESIGSMLAKIGHEAGVYGRGANVGLAVTTPATTPGQLREYADVVAEKYEGAHNAGKTMVLPTGTTVERIGLTMGDAQFVESLGLDVDQAARIINVTVSLLGGGAGSTDGAPITPEHESKRWAAYGLGPRLARIESAYDADPQFFGPGSRVHPAFVREGIVTADLETEDAITHQQIQDGRLMPDEWRVPRGMPPLPGGVGMTPQITPVGGAPNANAPAPQPAPAQEG